MSRIFQLEDKEEHYRSLLAAFSQVEKADNTFIKNISKAVSRHNIQEIDVASLLLVNRLFTQSCRMQIYCLKDLLLSLELINSFDRALDVNAVRAEEQSEGQLK
jgi:phosphate:Na+ symporter